MGPSRDEEPDDAEGEALAAEIAADRRLQSDRRKRWVLYLPPLASLVMAAAAIALSHPRDVAAASVIAGGRPDGSRPLHVRAMLVRARPGDDVTPTPLDRIEVRAVGEGVHGHVASPSDEEGVVEVVIDPPLPAKVELEGRIDEAWARLVTVSLDALPVADPSDGVLAAKRTLGRGSGDLLVDVAPDLGALAPPDDSGVWIRVRRKTTGEPVASASIAVKGEAGIDHDPADVTTDEAGLAHVVLSITAPPAIVDVTATKDDVKGAWQGAIGNVLGVPNPRGWRASPDAPVIELAAPPSLRHAYVDVFQKGVRIDGGAVFFADGGAKVSLPKGSRGLFDLEVSTTPRPSSTDDLTHAATWPVIVAADAVDAWSELVPPRIDDRIPPAPGSMATYESAVAATLARAPVVVPHRTVVADGLPPAMAFETARIKRVRRGASLAIVGGGLVEFGLMLWLGVFASKTRVEDELRMLAEDGELGVAAAERAAEQQHKGPGGARTAAIVITAVGIVALVFAALAVMAWGLPGLSF